MESSKKRTNYLTGEGRTCQLHFEFHFKYMGAVAERVHVQTATGLGLPSGILKQNVLKEQRSLIKQQWSID